MQTAREEIGVTLEFTDKTEVPRRKKLYTSPSLQAYGKVSETTRGSRGLGRDGVVPAEGFCNGLEEGVVQSQCSSLVFCLLLSQFQSEILAIVVGSELRQTSGPIVPEA